MTTSAHHRQFPTTYVPAWHSDPASIKQAEQVAKLRTTKALDTQAVALLASWDDDGHTKGLASALLDNLFAADWAPRKATAAPVTEAGMYRNADGVVYRVKAGRNGGKLYAKELVITQATDTTGVPLLNAEGRPTYTASFEYAQGAIYRLSATDKMSTEERSAFGHDFGVCCTCGATLTDPESIQRGQGPVCAAK